MIAITPRQLRLTPREGRTFYAGRGIGTAAPPEPAAPGQIPPQPPGGQVPGAPPPPVHRLLGKWIQTGVNRSAGLALRALAGIELNPLTEHCRLTRDPAVNYLSHFER